MSICVSFDTFTTHLFSKRVQPQYSWGERADVNRQAWDAQLPFLIRMLLAWKSGQDLVTNIETSSSMGAARYCIDIFGLDGVFNAMYVFTCVYNYFNRL